MSETEHADTGTCFHCGKPVEGFLSAVAVNVCSPECWKAAMAVRRTCVVCFDEFKGLRERTGEFCSGRCERDFTDAGHEIDAEDANEDFD